MELTVIERMAILSLLGPEGDLVYLKAKREIVKKVGLTADEIINWGVKSEGGNMKMDPEENWEKVVEISFSGGEAAIVAEALTTKLTETKKLHQSELSLYEKFVEK